MKKYNIIPIREWFSPTVTPPLIIAGPCSAESYAQIRDTAFAISKISKVNIFRSGVWKPRTKPKNFEGAGNVALDWLLDVKKEFNLKTAVEVLSPIHVELCLKKEVDILWIGTRTTSNPYSVQEIAQALKGTNTIVLVKNPINPDINLWIGAVERLLNVGIQKIALIHRGFYPFEPTKFRNIPKWELIIDLKTQHSYFPVICDPSHIAGNTRYILPIAQKAMDLCYDGLMIETHIKPNEALSDNNQQLTPVQLKNLLDKISYCGNNDTVKHLELIKLREKVDSVDMQLLELLHYRMEIIKEMSAYKKHHQLPILQLQRWKQIVSSRLRKAKELNMNPNFIKSLLEIIHMEALRIQSEENTENNY
ncbi:MAG: bifunctional 3-deoxy-7-phosphoheptulonate synthase/chorismate mutase type II [Bacteroidales bacterium]|nr:bifunctional 3-deoxy-7-phosphoheptulonate synthase/chorismate mutase type II [Bacteroidales bacterium]